MRLIGSDVIMSLCTVFLAMARREGGRETWMRLLRGRGQVQGLERL
jgi:hypothetical protein